MANALALDEALIPMLNPGPVLLDGYPRTMLQYLVLPTRFDVVMLRLDKDTAIRRANQASAASGKQEWSAESRWHEQRPGLNELQSAALLVIDVAGKTPGEVAFEILSSEYLGPPIRR
jgi:hypothetical protein